ncbi:MAG: ornithine cyclodeaminase family protein [Actinobacteria bacterium]|nr:ornithine cyclodeaminase family protein [Actinomycetota bacterium]
MSVLVLSEHDVRAHLPMRACIDAMAGVLAALARGELFQPLRFVVRPPGAAGLMGFMSAHRSGPAPAFSLKEIVVAPGNPARGLDAHQGTVLLHDGETGELRAILNASPVTEIRTAAVSAVATRALARPGAGTVAILGAGVQARSHVEAMRCVLADPEIRIWSRTAASAQALARETGARACATVEEALAGAGVVCTTTSAREPVLRREWLAPGAHVNAVGSSVPSTRELDTATVAAASLFVDRRESTLNEAGDYLFPAGEGVIGPEHIRAELGEVLTGAHPGRTAETELTIFKSLGLAVEDLAAAELAVGRARAAGAGTEVAF